MSRSPIDLIRERLDGVDGDSAKCPAHDDERNSLTFSEGNDGRVLIKCHAGCSFEEITEALELKPSDFFPSESRNGSRSKIVAEYDYQDEGGVRLFQAVRFEPKKFRQRHYNPAHPKAKPSGWVWSLKGVRRVLYRLPGLLAAVEDGGTIFIVEGEKDVHALESLGLYATCNPMGAGKWRAEYSGHLRGADVVVLPDNDDAGRDHAETVARSLQDIAHGVKVVELPGLPEKGDVSDWLKAGGTRDALLKLVASTAPWQVPVESQEPPKADEPSEGRPSAATETIKLVQDVADLYHHNRTMLFARRKVDGASLLLDSDTFKYWVADLFLQKNDRALPSAAFGDALNTLKGIAMREHHPAHVRTCGDLSERIVYVNLGGGRITRITPDSIDTIPSADCAARFWEPAAAEPLPDPDLSGDLDDIGQILDLSGVARLIAAGWLIAAFLPDGPFPVLGIFGGQGSGKSTRTRQLVSLVDPSGLLLRTSPRSEDDLIIAARLSHVLAYDNLSKIPDWLSDALCRIATGGGIEKRALYTNLDSVVVSVKRPVILNAIIEVVTRSDLADRLWLLELPPLRSRQPERVVRERFRRLQPRAIGAIFRGIQAALAGHDAVTLMTLDSPQLRMIDACMWAEAGLQGLGAEPDAFSSAYMAAHEGANRSIVESELLGSLIDVLAQRGGFEGTASKLLERLETMAPGQRKSLPADATRLSSELRRLQPALLAGCDVEVEFDRTNSKRTIQIHAKTPDKESEETASLASPASQNGKMNGHSDAGDASDAKIQKPDRVQTPFGAASVLQRRADAWTVQVDGEDQARFVSPNEIGAPF